MIVTAAVVLGIFIEVGCMIIANAIKKSNHSPSTNYKEGEEV